MMAERFVRALAGLVLLIGACGPEEVGPLDPSTFAGMNRVKIEASCRKTVECNNMQNQYDGCVSRTADVLENDPTKRLNFLTNCARCSAFERCDFVNCANSMMPPVYGESQRNKVNYTCQQHWACEMLGGRAPANVAQAIDYCTAEGVGLLDSFAAARRAGFEQAFTSCQAMNTCEFVTCFQY